MLLQVHLETSGDSQVQPPRARSLGGLALWARHREGDYEVLQADDGGEEWSYCEVDSEEDCS